MELTLNLTLVAIFTLALRESSNVNGIWVFRGKVQKIRGLGVHGRASRYHIRLRRLFPTPSHNVIAPLPLNDWPTSILR
jgi:hypothetical protein